MPSLPAREAQLHARVRDFVLGVSSSGYFLALCTYNLCLQPLACLSYVVCAYIGCPPVQSFADFFCTHLLAAWFWSGGAMLISAISSTEIIATLILILWPIAELTWGGAPFLGISAAGSPVSFLSCTRWFYQALYAAELGTLPRQVQAQLPVADLLVKAAMASKELKSKAGFYDFEEYSLSEGELLRLRNLAWLYLFLYGLAFRVPTMLVLNARKWRPSKGCLTSACSRLYYRARYAVFVRFGFCGMRHVNTEAGIREEAQMLEQMMARLSDQRRRRVNTAPAYKLALSQLITRRLPRAQSEKSPQPQLLGGMALASISSKSLDAHHEDEPSSGRFPRLARLANGVSSRVARPA